MTLNEATAAVSRPAVAIRRAFVERGPNGERSPLEGLMSGLNGAGGGAGGRVRVALLVTLLWVIARPPHTTRRVAPWWASVLGMPDPQGNGARAIRDTLHELSRRGYISLVRELEEGNEITLLSETGSGEPYSFPSPDLGELYFRVPRALWDNGWIFKMSGRALAVYLVIAANSGWRDEREFWISSKLFHDRYGLGETTRKRGFRELVELGVLEVAERSVTRQQGTRTFRRNVYVLTDELRYVPAVATVSIDRDQDVT